MEKSRRIKYLYTDQLRIGVLVQTYLIFSYFLVWCFIILIFYVVIVTISYIIVGAICTLIALTKILKKIQKCRCRSLAGFLLTNRKLGLDFDWHPPFSSWRGACQLLMDRPCTWPMGGELPVSRDGQARQDGPIREQGFYSLIACLLFLPLWLQIPPPPPPAWPFPQLQLLRLTVEGGSSPPPHILPIMDSNPSSFIFPGGNVERGEFFPFVS